MSILIRSSRCDSASPLGNLSKRLLVARRDFVVPVGTKSAPRAQKRFRRENVTASPYGRKRAGKKSSELAKSQRTKHRSAAIEAAIPANTPHTTPLYNTKMACIASTFTGSVAALKASKVQVRRATRARALSRASPAREVDVGKLRFPAAGAALPAPGLVRGRRLRRIARRRRSPNAPFRRSPGRSRAPDPRDGPGVARPARRERFREFLVQLNSAVAHHATSGD